MFGIDETKRPRWWPSVAVGAGALVLAGIVSNVMLYLIVSPTLGPGQEFGPEAIDAWMQQNMATPSGFFSMLIPIHLSILLLALLAASRSRTPLAQRLGLVRGTATLWQYPVLMLSSLGAAAISGWLFLAHISPGQSDMTLALAFAQLRGLDGALIILYTATLASFSEEMLFSGFVLRGLLRRWRPFLAIGLVALLFALIHPSPFFMLHALPIGIWGGIIVWRTGSIWPAIACHSFLNIALALLNRWYPEPTVAFFGELTFWPITVGIFGVLMMVISIRLLFRSGEA
ncbi:MAG: CPBP family intramembrane metalloprotease [candidate division Zixibacteria bacterium]|nr:CPBP family intramembrane metalloprotease [candidate division Zixibacteria bacterium]